MKFICTEKYRTVNGYVFALGKPVIVEDRLTIEALEKDPAFRRIEDEKAPEEAVPAPATQAAYVYPRREILKARRR